MIMTGKRHPFEVSYEVGFDDEGRLLALSLRLASDCGATVAAVRESEANRRALEADLLALEQRVRNELEQARLSVHTARASLEAADEALSAARARLSLAEGRYEAGVGNAIELGDAQLALTSAGAQRVQFEYNLASARAQLLSALGKVQ